MTKQAPVNCGISMWAIDHKPYILDVHTELEPDKSLILTSVDLYALKNFDPLALSEMQEVKQEG